MIAMSEHCLVFLAGAFCGAFLYWLTHRKRRDW